MTWLLLLALCLGLQFWVLTQLRGDKHLFFGMPTPATWMLAALWYCFLIGDAAFILLSVGWMFEHVAVRVSTF